MLPQFIILSLISLCGAAVLPARDSISEDQQGGNSTGTPVNLQPDDVIVVGHAGNFTIMKEHEWDELVRKEEEYFSRSSDPNERISLPALNGTINGTTQHDPQLVERDCEKSFELQIFNTNYFSGWDVPMSGVMHATGATTGPGNTIAVTDGYSLANSITLGATASVNVIAAILSTSFSVQTGRTWTTSYSAAYTYSVQQYSYGIIVSNPWTRRVSGNTLSGCTNNWNKEYFHSDSFYDQSYNGLSWVQGIIRLCISQTYPVPYCTGNGYHH